MSVPRSSRQYVTIEEVYRRYGSDLLRYLHGANAHLNHQDCEDLLHQAIVKAVSSADQYDPSLGSLRVWLVGILRNEMLTDVRRRRRQAEPRLAELSEVVSGAPPPEADETLRDDVAAVERALGELPFAEREALLAPIRTCGEATTEQIAARLGIAPASVAVYRQRARERLRRVLEGKNEREGGSLWRNRPKNPIATR